MTLLLIGWPSEAMLLKQRNGPSWIGTDFKYVAVANVPYLGTTSRKQPVFSGIWRIESFYFYHCDVLGPTSIAHANVSPWNVLPT